MNTSEYRISLDLHRAVAPHVISLKRGDTARELHITLTDNGAPYVITNDCTAELVGYLPIQTAAELPLTAEGNVLSATIPSSWVTTAGEIVCEVRVYSGTSLLLISPSFSLYVGTEFGAAVTIDQTLPLITNADDGKALVANGGVWDKAFVLPEVTDSDSGKVLSVVDGEWDAAEPEKELPAVSSEDNGKVLAVEDGEWGVGQDLSGLPDLVKDVGELEEHYDVTPPTNLFDPSTLEVGKYCISTNLTRSSDDRYNLLTIPVEAGHSYLVARASDTATQGTQTGWSAVVFCDSDMNGLSVIRVATDSQYGAFEVPSGASFAVISYYASNTTPVIVEHAIPTAWTTRFDPEAAVTAPTYSVADDVIIPVDTLGESGKNIIDESKMISGYVYGALWTDSENYVSTKIIPVKPGTTYYSRTNLRYVSLYNGNKEYTHGFSNAAITSFTTDSSDVYARITAYSADAGKIMVSTDASAFYEPYKKVFVEEAPFLNEAQKNDVGEYLFPDNVLKGKKWVVCGDSFSSYGGTGTSNLTEGIYKGQHYVYPYIIGNRTGARIVSFAAGGRTLGYNDNPNSLTCPTADCYYQNIPEDADYVTIYLGINDDDYGITLGTINDADSSTYLGAYNEVISWLIEHRPFAHLGIIVSNATDNNTWTLGQIAIAEKYGVPYLNLNGDERTPAVFRSTNPNIPSSIKAIVNAQRAIDWDGSRTGTANKHPNDATQLFESTIIENFLKSL